ncbi:nuclear protein localization protein 4 [Nematocida sp. AWRm78]|nr:nuclear protein localization protein 4 [Nematocida sp. AWRm79]KAI5183330.1 nuclear protein localization protein 4 [Nematocida sp. AWRm78]
MIIRVQGRDRTMRIEVEQATTIAQIMEEVSKRVNAPCVNILHNGKNIEGSVGDNNLENGEMLTAEYEIAKPAEEDPLPAQAQTPSEPAQTQTQKSSECSHGPSGMCSNCMSEDSWVSEQFKERRFISQGAYEEYLASKEKVLLIETHLPPACRTHRPEHRCNKCMPKEISLGQQPFRPIDHIEVHDRAIIEQILIEQKEKNTQSVHLLIGRYSEYPDVPKGRKAEVFARITPTQKGLLDGFIIDPNDKMLLGTDESLNRVLNLLQMEIVGMVYTRITKEPMPYISALEIDFIANMQNRFAEWAAQERKGSKFVTLILSGTPTSSEIVECMVTHLGMELSLDGVLHASVNRQEMSAKSVDMIWRDKEGSHTGSRIPVEYLAVRPTHGLTQNKSVFYIKTEKTPFKRGMGVSKLKKHFQRRLSDDSVCLISLAAVSDIEVLLELADMNILSDELVECVANKDTERFKDCVLNGRLEELVDIAKECKESSSWACNVCTLVNAPTRTLCDACGFEKGAY